MAEKNGNGQRGADLIVDLHAEVVELKSTLAQHHQTLTPTLLTLTQTLQTLTQTLARQHQETDQHLGRITRMLGAVGDKLRDHEARLSAVEAKVG